MRGFRQALFSLKFLPNLFLFPFFLWQQHLPLYIVPGDALYSAYHCELHATVEDILPDVFCLMVRIFLLMLVLLYINSTNIPPIIIINRIYETHNILSLQLVYVLVGLRTFQHPCNKKFCQLMQLAMSPAYMLLSITFRIVLQMLGNFCQNVEALCHVFYIFFLLLQEARPRN